MLNLLTKTKPWMVASLLAATSAFGQNNKCPPQSCSKPCEKVCPEPMQAPTIAAYNAPAGIDTRCSWDVFIDAAFIYWQPIQENLELATTVAPEGEYGNVVNMSFSYKPGFKVGLGFSFDYDNWDIYGEYTRFHGQHSQSASVASPVTATNGLATTTLPPITVDGDLFGSLNQTWRLNMDIADLIMGREYYVGTKLTFKTFFGARGAWIRQKLQVTGSDGFTSGGGGDPASATSTQTSHSWAVGPRAGLNTNWMLGEGFRLIGNGAADILYTRYTTLKVNASVTDGIGTRTVLEQQKNMGYLRTHVEMELGFGWGSYFDNNNWHFDLAATYGFQTFFDQNMFRQFCDDVAQGTSFVPNGNLYVQGLNLIARFDF